MGTGIPYVERGNEERHHRWDRLERATLFEQYHDLHAQGTSQREAAKALAVPRSTLQAWQAYQERLEACPTVVAFFHSVPGLTFLHRLVLAIHLVCTEVGACGIRLVCLLLKMTGLNRLSAPRMGRSTRLTVAWKRPSWRTATRRARGWRTRCPPKRSR